MISLKAFDGLPAWGARTTKLLLVPGGIHFRVAKRLPHADDFRLREVEVVMAETLSLFVERHQNGVASSSVVHGPEVLMIAEVLTGHGHLATAVVGGVELLHAGRDNLRRAQHDVLQHTLLKQIKITRNRAHCVKAIL